jgi:hypothetical protein
VTTLTDLDARAARVAEIAKSLFGKALDREVVHIEELVDDEVHERDIDVMFCEIPADMAGAAASMFGTGGFSAVIVGQSTRLAPRRVVTMQNQTIVCPEMDTMAFYKFKGGFDAARRAGIAAAKYRRHHAAEAKARPVKHGARSLPV